MQINLEKIMAKKTAPIHAGEILAEEFLEPFGITAYRLAKDINVSPTCISEIIHAKRGISCETALRLGKYFGTGADFWINIQKRFELDVAEDKLGSDLKNIIPIAEKIA